MRAHRWIENESTGNSGKRWLACWPDGEPVLTMTGEPTVFTCGSREASRFEHKWGIYLREDRRTAEEGNR